jgi:DNA-binding transcriptional regulator YiaG
MTADEIRSIRTTLGLPQSRWAELLGIGREHVAKIETGKAPISAPIQILAALYQTHPQLAQERPPQSATPADPASSS